MRLIVYEYVSGGGLAGQPISPGVLSEGFGILRTIVSDFKSAGHEITVLLDSRLSKLNPPINADYIVPVFYSQEPQKFLVTIAKINDAILVIAPETGQTLQLLVELVETSGKVSLNCESTAIEKVADKTILYKILEKNGLSFPKTVILNMNDDLAKVKETIKSKLLVPLLFKPVDGVSCGGLSIVKVDAQIEKAIEKIKSESAKEHFIVQEYIEGEAVSVSLLCTKSKASAISLNQQTVKVGAPDEVSSYEGGVVPFDNPYTHDAFALAEKVAGCFTGLKGYVGVDLVLAKDNLFVVDVNPRLTTSYVGLSGVANFNVAEGLVNAVLKGEIPDKPETRGYVCFSKMEIPSIAIPDFQIIAELSEVVSPPFPLNHKTCMLIAGKGATMDEAIVKLEEAKKRILNIISRGK